MLCMAIENYAACIQHAFVFVHSDGWIVAYYLKTDPAAKMIDVIAQPLDAELHRIQHLLEKAIGSICSIQRSLFLTMISDNPDATGMLLVAEDKAEDGGDLGDDNHWFTIALPSSVHTTIFRTAFTKITIHHSPWMG
jgi:hypothetical protein